MLISKTLGRQRSRLKQAGSLTEMAVYFDVLTA
jgi:hypothetical protein